MSHVHIRRVAQEFPAKAVAVHIGKEAFARFMDQWEPGEELVMGLAEVKGKGEGVGFAVGERRVWLTKEDADGLLNHFLTNPLKLIPGSEAAEAFDAFTLLLMKVLRRNQ